MFLLNVAMAFRIGSVAGVSTTYVAVINNNAKLRDGTDDPNYGTTSFNYTNVEQPPNATGYPLGYLDINITVIDVLELAGWQVNLTYAPTLLQVDKLADISYPADHVFAGLDPYFAGKGFDNTIGYLKYACSIGPESPATNFTGSGTMCQIRLKIIQEPSSLLSCDLFLETDQEQTIYTSLRDVDIEPIDFTPQHGYYEYKWPPPPPPPSEGAAFYVEPPEIINSSIVPPQTIQINVTIKNVTDMHGYEFHLSYDPDILLCISLTILDVLGETHYIPEFSVDNTAGIVKVNVTYYPPAVPITTVLEVPLVNLIYRVKGYGATLLHLHNTNLTDSLGRPIPCDAHDGFFMNLARDLAITNVVPCVAQAYPGNIVKINVTAKNLGEVIETSVTVEAYYESNLIGTIVVTSLNPSEEITVTFDWNTLGVAPCCNYTISGEVAPVPFELDFENNVFIDGTVKIKVIGDVNGDGKVELADLMLVIKYYGTTPSSPNWYPDADVNGDGKVELADLMLVLKYWG